MVRFLAQVTSILLVAIDCVGSALGEEDGSDGTGIYFFFEGRWSLPSSLVFIVVVYHIRRDNMML